MYTTRKGNTYIVHEHAHGRHFFGVGVMVLLLTPEGMNNYPPNCRISCHVTASKRLINDGGCAVSFAATADLYIKKYMQQ